MSLALGDGSTVPCLPRRRRTDVISVAVEHLGNVGGGVDGRVRGGQRRKLDAQIRHRIRLARNQTERDGARRWGLVGLSRRLGLGDAVRRTTSSESFHTFTGRWVSLNYGRGPSRKARTSVLSWRTSPSRQWTVSRRPLWVISRRKRSRQDRASAQRHEPNLRTLHGWPPQFTPIRSRNRSAERLPPRRCKPPPLLLC
jgi:hypothetical protein